MTRVFKFFITKLHELAHLVDKVYKQNSAEVVQRRYWTGLNTDAVFLQYNVNVPPLKIIIFKYIYTCTIWSSAHDDCDLASVWQEGNIITLWSPTVPCSRDSHEYIVHELKSMHKLPYVILNMLDAHLELTAVTLCDKNKKKITIWSKSSSLCNGLSSDCGRKEVWR